MDKAKALELMESGERITHRHFSPNEWMTFDYPHIVFEDGCKCTPEQFFSTREEMDFAAWQDGYSIFEDNQQ